MTSFKQVVFDLLSVVRLFLNSGVKDRILAIEDDLLPTPSLKRIKIMTVFQVIQSIFDDTIKN